MKVACTVLEGESGGNPTDLLGTGITLEDALDFFYTSSIYQMMNEGIADMHCRSDGYLAELIKEEWKKKNKTASFNICSDNFSNPTERNANVLKPKNI